MRRIILCAMILTLLLATGVNAGLYDIWQDTDFDGTKDTFLGTVSGYSGGISSVSNYNYYSASAHPINGPTPEAFKSKMFMYEGSDGLSFNFIHNVDQGGGNYWNHVGWDFQFRNMTSSVGLTDDATPEHQGEIGIVAVDAFNYNAGWAYILNTDGGLFNNLVPLKDDWEIWINPFMFGDIQDWSMYSADGSLINLWMNPALPPVGLGPEAAFGQIDDNRAYSAIIAPHAIPEPATLILFGSGLLGGALAMRRRRK